MRCMLCQDQRLGGLGSLLAAVLSVSVNFSQFALQKFHQLTGRVGTDCMSADDSMSADDLMSDGLCCDFGKRSRL